MSKSVNLPISIILVALFFIFYGSMSLFGMMQSFELSTLIAKLSIIWLPLGIGLLLRNELSRKVSVFSLSVLLIINLLTIISLFRRGGLPVINFLGIEFNKYHGDQILNLLLLISLLLIVQLIVITHPKIKTIFIKNLNQEV